MTDKKSFGSKLSRAFEDTDEGASTAVIFIRNVLGLVVLPLAMILTILFVLGIIASPFIVGWVVFF